MQTTRRNRPSICNNSCSFSTVSERRFCLVGRQRSNAPSGRGEPSKGSPHPPAYGCHRDVASRLLSLSDWRCPETPHNRHNCLLREGGCSSSQASRPTLAGGDPMMELVDSYLALRRAVGFELKTRNTCFEALPVMPLSVASHMCVQPRSLTGQARVSSLAQRDERLRAVIRFADHLHVEDQRHQVPPRDVFGYRKSRRRIPFIYSGEAD